MQTAEIRDASKVVGSTLDEFATLTRDVHRAVADRVFGLLGRPAVPVELAHRAVSEIAYASVRAGVRYGPRLAGLAFSGDARSVHDDPLSRRRLAAFTGALGDRIADEAPALSRPLQLRTGGGPCRVDMAALAGDVVDPTGRIVIFLHGLCESDASWWLGAEKHWGDADTSYGRRLEQDAGWSSLYASFNTGLHISQNGAELAGRLDEVLEAWPVPVAELCLVGHSLGGLVVRSACQQGLEAGRTWVESVRTVVMLGTPHLGAPLERVVNRGTHLLARLPETAPLAGLLNRRSVGIKDLRHGSIVEADWLGYGAEDQLDHCTVVDLLPRAEYYTVAATLTRRFDSPLQPVLGDLLVQYASATGQHPLRRIPFREDGWHHVGRAHHFDLLNHPAVYAQLRHWLA